MAPTTQRRPAVFLFGPTAVGKTDLIGLLSPDLFEVVSADSQQVYRRMDIGTAKPSLTLLSRIRHHLIDVVDPSQQFDVGEFVRLAESAMRDVWSRRRIPVVSGGAGYYLKRLLYGLPLAPASTPEIREVIQARLTGLGLPALYDQLKAVDPVTAARIASADRYRITRALEVFEKSGRPLSEYPAATEPRSDIAVRLIGLDRPRPELHQRIRARVVAMIGAGLRREIEELLAEGHDRQDPGLRGIGYREFFDSDGTLRSPAEDAAISQEIQQNTRRYCKRQLTFFRSLPNVSWFSADAVDNVVAEIDAFGSMMAYAKCTTFGPTAS